MNKIKELRKENNITVAELAKELGISQSMLTNYENGNGTPRDDSIWDRLSQLFGVSKSHVMGLTTDIDVVHRKKKFKAVVDMSEPISIQVENQTDIDILTKLDLLDDEDTNKVLDFINNLLTIKNITKAITRFPIRQDFPISSESENSNHQSMIKILVK